jgi:transposase-like protein
MPAAFWRWVQAYAPELNKRCRPHLKPANKSYRIDETYIKYLYRALDSTGQTIDFLLTAKRDTAAAKRFLCRAIDASGNPMPRVVNVDKNPAYPAPSPGASLYASVSISTTCLSRTTVRLKNEFGWPRAMDPFRVCGARCRESRQ